ncbi:hypothetical protein, partial [Thalassobius sp. I31.1]|uniref:hypothetical protein n=1 Tax=Thalassobius sp. I31.1 TaxID=2109912 RepID=UPI001E30E582
ASRFRVALPVKWVLGLYANTRNPFLQKHQTFLEKPKNPLFIYTQRNETHVSPHCSATFIPNKNRSSSESPKAPHIITPQIARVTAESKSPRKDSPEKSPRFTK